MIAVHYGPDDLDQTYVTHFFPEFAAVETSGGYSPLLLF
jgi:hypothetical protein